MLSEIHPLCNKKLKSCAWWHTRCPDLHWLLLCNLFTKVKKCSRMSWFVKVLFWMLNHSCKTETLKFVLFHYMRVIWNKFYFKLKHKITQIEQKKKVHKVHSSLSQWEELYELNLFEVSVVVCVFAKKSENYICAITIIFSRRIQLKLSCGVFYLMKIPIKTLLMILFNPNINC